MQLWFPRHERGLVQGVSHSASRLGAAIAPPFAVAIIAAFGWRWVFYICGALGLLWSVLWYCLLPQLAGRAALGQPRRNSAYIRGVDEQGNIKPPPIAHVATLPWGVLFRSPNMWAIMCAYFTYVYCLWIFLSWLPSYLVEYRHFTLLKVGIFASLPLWAGVVGDTFGGLATDWLLVKTGRTKLAHRLVAIVGMLGCAALIVPAALADNAYTAVVCLTGALFFLECTIGPSWAVPMHVGGQYSGTVSGVMNMAGNIGGALSPIGVRISRAIRLLAGAVHRRRGVALVSVRRCGLSGSIRRNRWSGDDGPSACRAPAVLCSSKSWRGISAPHWRRWATPGAVRTWSPRCTTQVFATWESAMWVRCAPWPGWNRHASPTRCRPTICLPALSIWHCVERGDHPHAPRSDRLLPFQLHNPVRTRSACVHV